MKTILIKTIIFLAITAVVGMVSLGTYLHIYVRNSCNAAKSRYSGDCLGAQSQVLLSESEPIKTRNDAIWVLGQLADPRALSVLKKFYSGSVPQHHEPLDQVISQYELEKAIRWCEHGNGTSWMYKGL